MDAAARDELHALRERAYGPHPDIARDPDALARLALLEERALPAAPASDIARTAEEPLTADGPRQRESGEAPAAADRPLARISRAALLRRVGLVAAAVALAIPLGVVVASAGSDRAVPARAAGSAPASVSEALALTNDPRTKTLIRVRIDGSFGDYVDITPGDEVPAFPVDAPMRWVEPLGDYYGWRVWIGGARGADGDQNCLLLDGDGTMRASCVPVDLKAQGALLVSVPIDGTQPGERPETMTVGHSLVFWWGPDGVMSILLAPSPPE